MALELNGTTGVSLVQDGVVATADLADGAVTAAKINSAVELGKFVSYAVVADQKGDTTAGGTFTSGAHRIRDLNTEVFDPDGIVSLSSNQFTLQAGTYLIRWSAPAYKVDRHATRLFNVSDSSAIQDGSSAFTTNADAVVTRSFGNARVTLASAKAFEIRHKCEVTKTTNGLGVDSNTTSTISTYTIVEIFKEA